MKIKAQLCHNPRRPYDEDSYPGYLEGDSDYMENNRELAITPLIAACRCFVASKLGDEVEIPDELL